MLILCKQKTAYDRRISDWSSYVCSSDLIFKAEAVEEIAQHGVVVMGKALELAARVGHLRQRLAEMLGHHLLIGHIVRHLPQPVHIVERKGVVEGKNVSVRVNFGGGRVTNTKKQNVHP